MERKASVERITKETQVAATLNVDGSGQYTVFTGVGFLDHMLELLTKHSMMDLELTAKGDLEVDQHHTVEDVGIVLGECLLKALGDKRSIYRFGEASVPMDESLAEVVIDLSGRPAFAFNVEFKSEKISDFDVDLVEEFLSAFAENARLALHVNVPYGKNAHHICEAVFKAIALALRRAVSIDPDRRDVPSTKGVL